VLFAARSSRGQKALGNRPKRFETIGLVGDVTPLSHGRGKHREQRWFVEPAVPLAACHDDCRIGRHVGAATRKMLTAEKPNPQMRRPQTDERRSDRCATIRGRPDPCAAGCARRHRAPLASLAVAWLLIAGCGKPTSGSDASITVFAAASLRDVLVEVGTAFEAETGIVVQFNFAGSNVLAQQIVASGAADLFVSADSQWIDFLDHQDLLVAGSRRSFLANRLVVIANGESEVTTGEPLTDLGQLADLDFRYLSIADPRGVPAGRYAREALEQTPNGRTNLWQALETGIAPATDVRAALALVESRRDAVGIVYLTDAQSSTKVRILLEIPEPPAPVIRYQLALLRSSPHLDTARQLAAYLTSSRAATIFNARGFELAPGAGAGTREPPVPDSSR
jgi:molybdate transport system substrate-binding protein